MPDLTVTPKFSLHSIRVNSWAFARDLFRDDQGQATVEYILILGMVTTVAVSLTRAILGALDRGVLSLGAQLEKDLKTGRVQISVWKN